MISKKSLIKILFGVTILFEQGSLLNASAQQVNRIKTGEYEIVGTDDPYPYVVLFPGQPKEEMTNNDIDLKRKIRRFKFIAENDVFYIMEISSEEFIENISSQIYQSPKKAIEDIRSAFIKGRKSDGWNLIQVGSLHLGYYLEWEIPRSTIRGKIYMKEVTYLRAGRLYSAIVTAPTQQLANDDSATRFLNSLGFPGLSKEDQIKYDKKLPAINKWYRFTGPDREFSLMFPIKPKLEITGQGAISAIRHYQSIYGSYVFSVNMQDFGGDPASHENNVLSDNSEQIYADEMKSSGVRVLQIRRIAPNIIEREEQAPNGERTGYIHSMSRWIIHRGKGYTIGCARLIDDMEVDKSTCRTFFKTLKFFYQKNFSHK